ncbi:uracil-DNA glycosylase-like isoform X2 [Pecten maximus]|uniref:uracil-DNA glycosylase-like isoform X2 n=1 Tax=Pecten maximus TaxID=6579 RepID=UPI00145812D6|nr:uracil-DNA glycosylase-like isoform X2 [Pecten maximus]
MPPKRKRVVVAKQPKYIPMPPKCKSSEDAAKKKPKTTKRPAKKGKGDDKGPTSSKKAKVTAVADKNTSVLPAGGSAGSLDLSSYLTDEAWKCELKDVFTKDYFKDIEANLVRDYAARTQVFPPKDLIFKAFNLTPFDKVKVVIIGQDPYHDSGQAMGMAFSVPLGTKPPPSLKNIYKELTNDKKITNFETPTHGNLEDWAKRGVFLLNATLTVEAHKPNSHSKYGWQKFTDQVIRIISKNCSAVVFLLWGNFAHKKESLIDKKKHSVIKTAHPSPLSYKKFENCKCFSLVDEALMKKKQGKMDWSL